MPYGLLLAWQKIKTKRLLHASAEGKANTLAPVKHFNLSLTRANGLNTFSQEGEDLLLRAFSNLYAKDKGFYIDIGAFHPVAGSNTKCFYDKGWRGINIDPNPQNITKFKELRPRDINLPLGAGDQNTTLNYYYFGPNKSINTFDATLAKRFSKTFNLPLPKPQKVVVRAVNEILAQHLPKGQTIDFLTLDVEGFEMRILKHWDFDKYRPSYILVEDLAMEGKILNEASWQQLQQSAQHKLLSQKGYHFKGKTALTLLYAYADEPWVVSSSIVLF